jgi:hypothetical protein
VAHQLNRVLAESGEKPLGGDDVIVIAKRLSELILYKGLKRKISWEGIRGNLEGEHKPTSSTFAIFDRALTCSSEAYNTLKLWDLCTAHQEALEIVLALEPERYGDFVAYLDHGPGNMSKRDYEKICGRVFRRLFRVGTIATALAWLFRSRPVFASTTVALPIVVVAGSGILVVLMSAAPGRSLDPDEPEDGAATKSLVGLDEPAAEVREPAVIDCGNIEQSASAMQIRDRALAEFEAESCRHKREIQREGCALASSHAFGCAAISLYAIQTELPDGSLAGGDMIHEHVYDPVAGAWTDVELLGTRMFLDGNYVASLMDDDRIISIVKSAPSAAHARAVTLVSALAADIPSFCGEHPGLCELRRSIPD